MPEIPAWSLVEWVGAAAGFFAVGFVAGLTRAYIRKLVSAA